MIYVPKAETSTKQNNELLCTKMSLVLEIVLLVFPLFLVIVYVIKIVMGDFKKIVMYWLSNLGLSIHKAFYVCTISLDKPFQT